MDPSTAAVNNGAVSATDDSTNTATINQSDETTGDGDGDGDKETTASVMDTTTTAVNNVVVSTNVSTNTTTTNQTDETTIKEEWDATVVVIDPNTAAVNRSFEGNDDDFLPRVSSSECLLPIIGKHSSLFFILSGLFFYLGVFDQIVSK